MYHFDFGPVFADSGHLLQGAAVTLELSCGAMLIGLVISIVCASAKTSHFAPLRWIISVYVEAIRNTPFLIQIFFIYFGLPAIGISLNPNPAALLALVINIGAYVAGSNPEIDAAIRVVPGLRRFLQQGLYEKASLENIEELMREALRGV